MRFSPLHHLGRHAALPAALAALMLGGCAAVSSKAPPAAQPAASAPAAPESAPGLVSVPSQHDVKTSLDRLTQMAQARGLMVFARVDHGGEAQKVNLPLRPTQLLILGAPKAGTPLMQSRQVTAIDLPLKVLAWEDAQGKTWLSYNDADWLQQRHGFTPALKANLAGLTKLVDAAAAR